jgi:paraquat-inducible protein B
LPPPKYVGHMLPYHFFHDWHRVVVKADGDQVRELSAEVAERVSRHDLQQTVNQQVKPLVISVSSLERAMQIQQANIQTTNTALQQQLTDTHKCVQQVAHQQQQQTQQLSQEMKKLVEEEVCERVGVFQTNDQRANAGAYNQPSLSTLMQAQLSSHADSLLGEVRNVSEVRISFQNLLIRFLRSCV